MYERSQPLKSCLCGSGSWTHETAQRWYNPRPGMAHLPHKLVSHAQKVRTLYRKAYRAVGGLYVEGNRWSEMRIHQMQIRAEFDKNKDINDPVKAKHVLEEGEERLNKSFSYHFWLGRREYIHANDPGGILYQAQAPVPDHVFDSWHPLERAQYPEYFARREQRKIEYAERWNAKYGKPDDAPDFSHLKKDLSVDSGQAEEYTPHPHCQSRPAGRQ